MSIEKKYAETPLMKQYYDIKALHPDAILLFRVGDFYETFGDDAIKASSILGITLTRRANGSASSVELAGFPHHAVDTYLPKLVRAGERVAICEQLEDPKTAVNKIVKRGVIELVTPGVSFSDNILDYKENNFLAAVCFGIKTTGAAFLDASTGEFYAAEGNLEYISKLISNLAPKEILYQKGCAEKFNAAFGSSHHTFCLDKWVFAPERNREKLTEQFQVRSLKGFGIDGMEEAVTAAGAILYYLDFTEHKNTKHISSISRIDEDKYVWIDRFSIHNLELFSSNGRSGRSFAEVMDRTVSPMGARMLKRWIALPLRDGKEINARLDTVGWFMANPELSGELSALFSLMGDLERLASKISVGRITPREMVQLKTALSAVGKAKDILKASGNEGLKACGEKLDSCSQSRERIEREVYPDPSNQIQKGGVIADGVSMELDDLRNIARNGKRLLGEIQERESELTGISSLKISFNNVFGYYIEVRNAHKDKVPPDWVRKQTLVGAERYITAELKEYEEKILGAEEKMLALEQQLFTDIVESLIPHLGKIQVDASVVARLDCLLSFSVAAAERNYCRPTIGDRNVIDIKQGRHPVIETLLPLGVDYVPNDVFLDDTTQQIMMITGPNMSGKSALLRQTALIVLMAQTGSYVPACAAEIGIVDKIFTRVGASDNISQGESTFMVEMLESAGILNNVTPRSLVLLDEIGRGTSTYDGISIAWAMVEYLHERHGARAKTLFATHYHELNEMETQYPRVKNYNVAIKEVGKNIVFLHRLMRGGTAHSFGIHVAKMAGMPSYVVNRASEILKELEDGKRAGIAGKTGSIAEASKNGGMQLSIFQMEDPVLKQIRDEIRDLQIDNLTPLEALNKLNEIKKISGL